MDKMESITEKTNSNPDMTGLPFPPENTEDTDLAFTERNWKSAAIPPPIIIAIDHWING